MQTRSVYERRRDSPEAGVSCLNLQVRSTLLWFFVFAVENLRDVRKADDQRYNKNCSDDRRRAVGLITLK